MKSHARCRTKKGGFAGEVATIEGKNLSYGVLEENKRRVSFNKARLLKKCREIGVKYAVVSRYIETMVVDVETSKVIICFNHSNEYIERLKELEILQKPSLNNAC